jgi:hypothetical protein
MKRIAKELGVPVAYFYCEEGTMAELILSIGKMNEGEQQLLLENIRVGGEHSE